MKRTKSIYIISGPAGVGKSTTSTRLVRQLDKSAYISGDDISHIPVNGRGKPWLCKDTHQLIWMNMLSLTKNLLMYEYSVVIDYVSFPNDVKWFVNSLDDNNIEVKYVILLTDLETLVGRDKSRPSEIQMGERSKVLMKEFHEAIEDERFILNTETYSIDRIDEVIEKIIKEEKYIWK
jgi:gluconate kinase